VADLCKFNCAISVCKMLKTYQKLRFNKIYLIKHISPYSNQPVPKEKTDEHYEQQLKEFQKISNIQQKVKTKKPQKPPFVKNLFLGIFDTDILTYPELKNEELDNLNKIVQQAQTVLEKPEVKECKQISRQFLKKLGAGQILGQQASQLMGGRELNAMETCRFTEAISEIDLKNVIVNNEKLGIQLLVKFGSDHLKRKYLQKLIDGDSLSAFCVVEPLPTNLDIFKKTAMPTSGGKTWVCVGKLSYCVMQ
jgi:acyl-CoA dehydrogenase family protein 9